MKSPSSQFPQKFPLDDFSRADDNREEIEVSKHWFYLWLNYLIPLLIAEQWTQTLTVISMALKSASVP